MHTQCSLCAETCSFALRARQAQCELVFLYGNFPIIVLRSPPSVEVWEPEHDLSLRVQFGMPRNRAGEVSDAAQEDLYNQAVDSAS
jgi:hypothetical protein